MSRIRGVEVFSWNPRRNRLPLLRRFAVGPRIGNFGDVIGPIVVARLLQKLQPRADAAAAVMQRPGAQLFAVGSVLHFANDHDVVWGTGINGKIPRTSYGFTQLDLRAVRGPRTRDRLSELAGLEAPAIYGDPALLVPELFPEIQAFTTRKTRRLALIPNLNDAERYRDHPDYVDPRGELLQVLAAIASSECVVGSSLHAIILAEALGVPCALLKSAIEPAFKYEDYALGTGRDGLPAFDELSAAITHARSIDVSSYRPLENWRAQPLIGAFPLDLWTDR